MNIIENNISELYRVFDLLNINLFKKELETPVILIQSKRKTILGTCSVNRIWANKTSEKKPNYYEITMSAENLDRTIEELVCTLLHEMIHLYCSLKDIKDTSNNHVYHNKRFKSEAESHGLIIEHFKTIGWSVSTLKEETKKLIKTFNINDALFEYYRATPERSKSTSGSKRNKYTCPCKVSISSSKELNIICGLCQKPFEKE